MRMILAAALILSACQSDRRFLGDKRPPAVQRLVFANYGEPATLDPALVSVVFDATIEQALFEGLAVNNPVTSLPMAGIATHYRVSADGREHIFYLRGNPIPRGTRLDDIASLPTEFSHGARAPADSITALWTDGSVVTAAHFVYAWQRVVDPRTASPSASDLAVILNAPDIVAGKRSRDQLGVEAVDDFTLPVRLEAPAPYFLSLVAQCDFLPVRRDTVVGRERVVGNGPFVLREWRPYDQVRVAKNSDYYAADLVRLDEVTFEPLKDSAAVNLYRAGLVHDMSGYSLPSVLLPALQHNLDLRRDAQNSLFHLLMNLHRPPFDNNIVRWVVNMALDKRAIADFSFGKGAKQLVPGIPGYTPPGSLMVTVGGKKFEHPGLRSVWSRGVTGRSRLSGWSGFGRQKALVPNQYVRSRSRRGDPATVREELEYRTAGQCDGI